MQEPFGQTIQFRLLPARTGLSLGPGWAAIAGILSGNYPDLNAIIALQFISLWILVDPVLGTLWALAVQQRLWQQIRQAQFPPAPASGFSLPYTQTESLAGQLVLGLRRYRVWWQNDDSPEANRRIVTVVLGLILALAIGAALGLTIFWLTILALSLTFLGSLVSHDLTTTGGGRLQSIVQFLLPWLMGILLWSSPTPFGLALIICYWIVYLGGLRMLGRHHRAELLFFLGQIAAIFLLLGLRLLPGAAVLSVLFMTQLSLKNRFSQPAAFLKKSQPYLLFGLLVAAWSIGGL